MDPFLSEEPPSYRDFPYVARSSAKWLFTMRMRKPRVNACFPNQSDLADERATLGKFMKHSSTSDKKVFTFRAAQALYFGLLLSILHGLGLRTCRSARSLVPFVPTYATDMNLYPVFAGRFSGILLTSWVH